MVEADYRQRLVDSLGKSPISKRSVQKILEDDFSKPTFNRNHTETRRHVLFSAYDPEGHSIAGDLDVQSELFADDYVDLRKAMEKLRPQQRELLHRIFWEGERQVDIAREEGVGNSVISERMRRIYKKLRKILQDQKKIF